MASLEAKNLAISTGLVVACAVTSLAQADWQSQVQDAIDGWNTYFGSDVQANGWTDNGLIVDETTRTQIVAAMTDPNTTWMPSIDTGSMDSATAFRIIDDPSITDDEIGAWAAEVDSLVEVGHRQLTVDWNKSGWGPFTTICIVDSNGIIYDSMFSNAIGGGGSVLSAGKRCLDYHMWWVWERVASSDPSDWTRGHIYADNNPKCRNGKVVSCDSNCDASMTAGEAEINCTTEKVGEDCCKLSYSWAWACGFKSVKVGADKFTLEVEGIIGSSGKGNGSCTVCCDELVAIEPGVVDQYNTLTMNDVTPGNEVVFVYGYTEGARELVDCDGVYLGIRDPRVIGTAEANADGVAQVSFWAAPQLEGQTVFFQGLVDRACRASGLLEHVFVNEPADPEKLDW